ncbi:Gfo/Idh/MocA family oxidoreductase [Xanthomonas sp. PPL568]|uniref:Gfo/Idh/MocA family protein n=1 Tax=Xanthomonas indica TaxID=2912242 RepID=UPI001F5761BA|nr:Gfo/Idh/MocA family oxidoreductase [Xanthomonas indica]MCI2243856.1 Gfo/Idh/MocA family oxidoreductase [Xanthomonas indica]
MNAWAQPRWRAPRLGFLGVGWIGRARMRALADSGLGQVVAIADASATALLDARQDAPAADLLPDLEALLAREDLDGVVIATPSGAHAAQAAAALQRGLAVFCQKPLTRTAAEAEQVLALAQRHDRLLAVDFSYRFAKGMATLREQIAQGALGEVFAIDLLFHNAYGPDKDWFYDIARSGGGCVMDLGIHLLDLAMWLTGSGGHHELQAALYAQGRQLTRPVQQVEDYASAQWRMDNGASVRMACSWRLPAGCDAVIQAHVYGTGGGAALRNVDGSFFDFTVDRFDGTRCERLASPPDAWGGRALLDWAERLGGDPGFDPAALHLLEVARTVDALYGR